jgi:hypothetical protein
MYILIVFMGCVALSFAGTFMIGLLAGLSDAGK